ncbi:MAG: hypothetical protein ACK5XN_14585, partial [Bacteroidota bacterium]
RHEGVDMYCTITEADPFLGFRVNPKEAARGCGSAEGGMTHYEGLQRLRPFLRAFLLVEGILSFFEEA